MNPSLQHKAALNPLHADRARYDVYFDINTPCPPDCYPDDPDDGSGCVVTEAIGNTGRAKDIYQDLYHNQVRQCNKLIENGEYEAVRVLFEQTMEYLIKEYLFS